MTATQVYIWLARLNTAITRTRTILKIVDFPAAFAPVRRLIFGSSPPNLTSFGMKSVTLDNMQGCRNSSNSTTLLPSSTNSGLQHGCPSEEDALAKLIRQSRCETILTAASQVE